MNLVSDVAIVTGASRGIGSEIAFALASVGAKIACVATRAENCAGTVQRIEGAGGVAKAYGCDISSSEAVQACLGEVIQDLGDPGILVNNAGLTRDTLMLRMKDDDWQRVLDVNLSGAFYWTRAVAKPMMKARIGRIVNIASVVGLHGAAGQSNYSASKAGLIGLTMSTAKELGSRGITCNAIAPGFIETDMTSDLSDDMKSHVVATAPAGRLGQPSDIAPAVVFLASEGAAYLTGQVITIDGGLFI